VPYRIDVADGGEDAFARLVDLGAIDAELTPQGTLAALMPDSVTPDQVSRALGVERVSVSAVTGRDAGSVWVLAPRPVRAGRLHIVPAGTARDPGDLQLVDSDAFGTGLHPTTRLCLEALDEAIATTHPDAMLDVGTGSGILALAALRLGVLRATGIDTDTRALDVAARNARLNQLDGQLQLVKGDASAVEGSWALVVANVLAAPLIEMAPTLVRRVGSRGRLVLSGVPEGMSDEVVHAYHHLGMQLIRSASSKGWIALVMGPSW
jgi:ribosomal protein L11 methyltransferase